MKYKVLTLVGLIVIVLLAATATAQNGSVTTGKTELKDADNLNVSENNVTAGKIRAVTSAMNFQGYLTDNAGAAINGNANITFTIWTALSGGSQVWSSGSQSVNIENGIFSIVLNVADSVFETGDDRWLQLNVEGEVLSPRVQITSVGYAYNAEKFDGHQWSDVQGGLSLPYSGSYSGSADAFEIEHAGEAGAVARFNSSNTSNSQPAVVIENQGSDPALYILNNNSQADEAVRIDNASNDDGIAINMTGSSGEGIQIEASENNTGHGISVYTTGTGKAGRFTINNASNGDDIIDLGTNGTGTGIDLNHSGASGRAMDIRMSGTNNPDELIWAQTKGLGIGAWFEIDNPNNDSPALLAFTNGTGYAGEFDGDVRIWGDLDVEGDLDKGSGSFKIDHPLDPKKKILRHSFVESPDMMNVYNGNVITDANGEAEVDLPDYFDALNQDFRYQLTVLGQFAQAIVAEEIRDNRFVIKTDEPSVKVSWQVTGIRKDPWAEKNRIVVEERKSPDTQGFYIHPEVYGQAENRSVEYATRNRN